MRLKRIKLNSDFRSLKSGFELDFLYEKPDNLKVNPYCIVGRNGSGKSNILELLASIFYSLELRCFNYLPEIFEDIDEKFKESNFPIINAPAIAYPFLRAFVSNFFVSSGYYPILLPTYNFTKFKKST